MNFIAFILKVVLNINPKVYSLSNGKKDFIGNDNWKCTAGVARITIDLNGKVYWCPFIKDSYLGNLNKENLSEVMGQC